MGAGQGRGISQDRAEWMFGKDRVDFTITTGE